MSKTRQADSIPLTDEEIADIKEYRAHQEDHMLLTPKELISVLHKAAKDV